MRIKPKYAVVFLNLIFLLSCQQRDSNVNLVTPIIEATPSYTTDSIAFPTPRVVHVLPFRIYSLPSKQLSSDVIVGYDRQTHNIDWYDTDKMEYRMTTQLEKTGPNGITEVASLYYHTPDSLFLLELNPNRLWLMDNHGNLKLIVDIKEKSNDDNGMEGLFAVNYNNSSPIYFTENRIFFALRSYENKFDFTIPVIGYYDLVKDELGTLDIYYPQEYRENAYGFFDFVNTVFTDSKIITNFPIRTSIYIYDLDGNLLKEVEPIRGIEAATPMESDDRSAEGFLAHLNSNPFLYPIQPFRNGTNYLQFGRAPVPEDKENTIFGYNLIYDHDFESVHIIKMNKILFSMYDSYLYHQMPLERSDTQYLERYEIKL